VKRVSAYAALVLLQVLVTAAPLALLPVLGLRITEMSESGPLWTALALGAPAITTLAMTPLWARIAGRVPLSTLILWTGIASVTSCALIAVADRPSLLVLGRLVQGLGGSGMVLALAFRASGASAGRSLTRMQQAVSAGCLAGPLLGGLAFEHGRFAGLNLAFCILILLATLVSMPAFGATPEVEAPHSTARRPHGLPLLWAGLCGSAGAFAFVAFFPAWASAQNPVLYTPGLIGLLHSLSWLVALLILPLWGRLIDTRPPIGILALSLAGCGLAFGALPWATGLAGIVALRLAQGALFSAQGPALLAATEATGPDAVTAMAHARASLTLGQLVGPLAAGLALIPFGAGGALWTAAGLSLAGAAGLLAFRFPQPLTTWSRAR
jgi:MFS transporter, DHA1 family, staphyloferrin B biosynthesis exporter